MSTTPAADLARVRARYPLWRIDKTPAGFMARRGGRTLTAPSLASLERQLIEGSTGE